VCEFPEGHVNDVIVLRQKSNVGDTGHAKLNAVVTCEIKLFQNYFSLRQRPSKINFYFIAWKSA